MVKYGEHNSSLKEVFTGGDDALTGATVKVFRVGAGAIMDALETGGAAERHRQSVGAGGRHDLF